MKTKILASVISAMFIVACSDSGSDPAEVSIQAYDGPIQHANVAYNCGSGGAGSLSLTDYDGKTYTNNYALTYTPELCVITIAGAIKSIDTANGKKMSEIKYVIPAGLAKQGTPISGTPLTTLIALQFSEDKIEDPTSTMEDATTKVFTALYGQDVVDALLNDGLTLIDFARDMQGSLKRITDPLIASQIVATNHVANDVIIAVKPFVLSSALETAKVITAEVIKSHPEYPISDDPADNGGEIFLTVAKSCTIKVYANTEDDNEEDPFKGVDIDKCKTYATSTPPPREPTGAS